MPSSSPSSSSSPPVPPSTASLPAPASSNLSTQELPPPASLPLRPLFLTLLLACPLLAALPPRKLDLFTLMLGGAWVLSAEEVGRGMRYGWYMQRLRIQEGGRGRAGGGEEAEGDIAEERGVSDRIGAEVEGVLRERGGGEGG